MKCKVLGFLVLFGAGLGMATQAVRPAVADQSAPQVEKTGSHSLAQADQPAAKRPDSGTPRDDDFRPLPPDRAGPPGREPPEGPMAPPPDDFGPPGPGVRPRPGMGEPPPDAPPPRLEGGLGHPPGGPGGPSGPGRDGPGRPGPLPPLNRWPYSEPESLRNSDPEMFKLVTADEDLDRQSRELAARLRQAPAAAREKLKEQLEEVVNKHFEARQQRRTLELKRLEEEIARLRQSLDARSKARKTIVERRMGELIGPEDRLKF